MWLSLADCACAWGSANFFKLALKSPETLPLVVGRELFSGV